MKSIRLIAAVILSLPAICSAATAGNGPAGSNAAQIAFQLKRERLDWLSFRIASLDLSDDAEARVIRGDPPFDAGKLSYLHSQDERMASTEKDYRRTVSLLASVIAVDARILDRYVFSLERTIKYYGHVNPLERELMRAVWIDLIQNTARMNDFSALAGKIGVSAPDATIVRGSSNSGNPGSPPTVGQERYNAESGDYEIYEGSGTWRLK